MDNELFLRGVNKRHRPPFTIEPVQKRGPASQQVTRWRLLDGDGYVIKRFAKWRYAYSALLGMAARCGVEPASETELRRLVREKAFADLRRKEITRSHKRRDEATRRMFKCLVDPEHRTYWERAKREYKRQKELAKIARKEETYRRNFKARYGRDPLPTE